MRVSSTSRRDSLLHAAMVESRSGMLLELSNPPERRGGIKAKRKAPAAFQGGRPGPGGQRSRRRLLPAGGAGGRQRPWSGGGGPAQHRTAAGVRGAWSIESPAQDGTRPRGVEEVAEPIHSSYPS
jgi:hypothetical protein